MKSLLRLSRLIRFYLLIADENRDTEEQKNLAIAEGKAKEQALEQVEKYLAELQVALRDADNA